MTHSTPSGKAAQRTRDTATSEHPRNEERTADADRGTESERSGERAAREQRFARSHPMPAERHE